MAKYYDTEFPQGNGASKEEITPEIAAGIRSGLRAAGADDLQQLAATVEDISTQFVPLKTPAASVFGTGGSPGEPDKAAVRGYSDSAKNDLSNTEALAQRGRPNRYAPQIGNAVVIGDSLSGGHFPVSGGGNDWPTQWAALTNWAGRLVINNLAVNSMRAANFAPQMAALAPQLKCPGGLAFVFLGQNDYAFDSAATIQANLATIWAALRAAGRIVVAFQTPSVSNATGQALTTRTAVNAWIGQQSDKWDACINLTDLTEASTVDTIHFTKAANLIVAQRIDAALGQLWLPDVAPAQRWQGMGVFRRASLYYPGVHVETDPTAWDLETDTNNATSTGLSIDGVPVYPFPFPMGQGLRVGIAAATQVTLPNVITLGGDFLVCAWLRPGDRHFGSASNLGTLIGDLSNSFIGITGSAGSGSATTVRPYVRIGGVDLTWADGVTLRKGEAAFIAIRRVNGLLTAWVNGVSRGSQISNTGTLTLDHALHRTASGAWLQADLFSLTVISGNVSERDLRHLMRGGSPLSLSATTELHLDFRDGSGSRPQSADAARRVFDLSAATNYAWIAPSGRPAPGVSADNGDANITLTVESSAATQRWATALTADRTAALPGSARLGARFRLVREATATGAWSILIGTGPVTSLSAPGTWKDIEFDGVWRVTGGGSL